MAMSAYGQANECFLINLAFVLTAVVFKATPLLLLTLLIGNLVHQLRQVQKRRVLLKADGQKKTARTTDRTTKMLIAIVEPGRWERTHKLLADEDNVV